MAKSRLPISAEREERKQQPEQWLWKSVIALAANDAVKDKTKLSIFSNSNRTDIDLARTWFLSPNKDFTLVCSLAGYNHMYVRSKMEKVINKKRKNESEKKKKNM